MEIQENTFVDGTGSLELFYETVEEKEKFLEIFNAVETITESISEVVNIFIDDLREKYPDEKINIDFIKGYLKGYELGRQEKETSKNDASC